MGMFDKDKEIGLLITEYVGLGEEFILWGVRITRDDFPTKLGPTAQTELIVSKTRTPGEKYTTTTLASAIAAKAREAEDSDFPAVCQLGKVESKTFGGDALVIRFLKPYGAASSAASATPAASEPAEF